MKLKKRIQMITISQGYKGYHVSAFSAHPTSVKNPRIKSLGRKTVPNFRIALQTARKFKRKYPGAIVARD